MIEIERPGALTTVQDLGRPGHAASGVPRGGAFDPWAARLANRLVGNRDDAALLEITLAGPTLVVEGPLRAALVGDPFEVEIEDLKGTSPSGALLRTSGRLAREGVSCFQLREQTRVAFGRARSGGVRVWLAFEGGIDIPRVLGSRSTDLAGGYGGHRGRALEAGDRLALFSSMEEERSARRGERVPADGLTEPGEGEEAERSFEETVFRVLPGPDRELLAEPALASLARAPWRVDPASDRRGVRLAGGGARLRSHEPLRSQPTLPGAVQATPSGELVVLGVDAPVTGGYPWVAEVIEADLGLLAHLAPGTEVRFEAVDLDTAERALDQRRRELGRLAAGALP